MSVPVILRTLDAKALFSELFGGVVSLVTEDRSRVETHFKTATFAGPATTTVATAKPSSAMVVTDIIVSGEKKAGGDILVQFTDGTNDEPIVNPILVDAPVNLHMGFQGRFLGWKDADIQVVATGTGVVATVTVGYYHVTQDKVQEYTEWDQAR